MKKVMLCVVLLLFCGCEEEFTPKQIQALAARNEVLQLQLDVVQAVAVEVAAEIQVAGIVDADAMARLAKVNAEVDRAQALMNDFARALEGVALTGDDAQDFISQLQAVNAASGGVNPYVIPIGAGLSILSIGLGWLVKRKTDEAGFIQVKYQAHKQGVEKTMKEVSASEDSHVVAVETQLYENIAKARADLGV